MPKKIKFAVLMFFIFAVCIFGKEKIQREASEDTVQKMTSPFGFYFGTGIVLSDSARKGDPPAGVAFNIGGEYEYRFVKYAAVHPSVDLSFFHYGWINNRAHITELENRTALTFAFLADMPLMIVTDVKNWTISIGAGVAFLIRFGVLEPNVAPHEKQTGAEITAAQELSGINKYFWSNGRFFYPSIRFKTEYTFASGWKTGFQIKTYLPIFNTWDKSKPAVRFSNEMLIQIGVVVHPAKKQ